LKRGKKTLIDLRDRADEVVGRRVSGDDKAAELVREVIASVDGHLDTLGQEDSRLKKKAATVGS
jgi:hypothetical protein